LIFSRPPKAIAQTITGKRRINATEKDISMIAAEGVLLTVGDLSTKLQVSPRQIYRLTDGGKLPAPVKVGAMNRWRSAEIDTWIAKGCAPVR
jgi:predicted DNA-binding transcriptional regulator AlpA